MSRLRDYAQLVRLPVVFTAVADILLAALARGALPERGLTFLLLTMASVALYWGGMVFNDFFDVDQDRRERPSRPIPSGRVTRRRAAMLGALLLVLGFTFALLAGATHSGGYATSSPIVALALCGAILAYDGWLKRGWAGPLAMGMCRFLNVLLGLTITGGLERTWGVHLALVVGLYIVGVTWFARTEARMSNQNSLTGAALVMLLSLLLALPLPARLESGQGAWLFPYLLVALGFLVGIPVCRAIAKPQPIPVQGAVRQALMGLVLLDAVLATAFVGIWGLLVLGLILPIRFLARWRWLYAT